MKSAFFTSITILLILGCANHEEKVAENIVGEELELEKEEIKATLTAMWDAVEKGDLARYEQYVHPDFTQFGEYDSALRVGKEAEMEGMRRSMAKSKGVHTEMVAPRITVKGNVAWVVYYWEDYGLSDGEPFSTHGKSTRIFVKQNDKWLCIHGHYTLLAFDR